MPSASPAWTTSAARSSARFPPATAGLLHITALIVIVILLFTYRSPVLWLLPVACVFVALTAAQAVIYLLARHAGLTVNGQSAFILTVLVFGAGTDDALLLVARYREELRRHADRHEAMAVALRRAGPAIIASGSTVILSLLTLLVAELNSTKSLGPVMAIGIAVGLCAMLTLLPALLVIFGRWPFWPVRPTLGSAESTERVLWARIERRMARRARVWVVTAMALGAMALGLTGLKASGLQNRDAFRTTQNSVTGEQALDRHFAAGAGDPVQVIGRAPASRELRSAVAGTPGVTNVTPPVVKDGLAYIEATLTSSSDSQAAFRTVDRLRAEVHAIPGADAKVGGGSCPRSCRPPGRSRCGRSRKPRAAGTPRARPATGSRAGLGTPWTGRRRSQRGGDRRPGRGHHPYSWGCADRRAARDRPGGDRAGVSGHRLPRSLWGGTTGRRRVRVGNVG